MHVQYEVGRREKNKKQQAKGKMRSQTQVFFTALIFASFQLHSRIFLALSTTKKEQQRQGDCQR